MESMHLALSQRGPHGYIGTDEDLRPSEEVWENWNEALGTSEALELRQSLETETGKSFCLDLEDSVDASVEGVMEEGFT